MTKQIYILGDDPHKDNNLWESTLCHMGEKLKDDLVVMFAEDNIQDLDAVIVFCPNSDVPGQSQQEQIYQLYHAGVPIILYQPNQQYVNTVYQSLADNNYINMNDTTISYSAFGFRRGVDGAIYILDILQTQEPDAEHIAQGILNFIEDKDQPLHNELKVLRKGLLKALPETEQNNLADMIQQYVVTHQFTLGGKSLSLSYFMASCHSYEGTSPNGGDDWYFIRQVGTLNGEANYKKYWAGSRVKVNGSAWYVGQGEVCLNYVDHYEMNNIPGTKTDLKSNETSPVFLIYAEPNAFNQQTTYTISESVNIAGSLGFEPSFSKNGSSAGLKASMLAGGSFDSSYSFVVQDCSCKGISLNKNTPSAGWRYDFKRASQNRRIGKWQRLHDPAKLSISVFSPTNCWVWKIPTAHRNEYKSFISEFNIGIMNTISRFSGSKKHKDIAQHLSEADSSKKLTIPLHMPPLIAVDCSHLTFSRDCSTQVINIACQGSWELSIPKEASWISIPNDELKGAGASSPVHITVQEFNGSAPRGATLKLKRETMAEEIQINVFQSNESLH